MATWLVERDASKKKYGNDPVTFMRWLEERYDGDGEWAKKEIASLKKEQKEELDNYDSPDPWVMNRWATPDGWYLNMTAEQKKVRDNFAKKDSVVATTKKDMAIISGDEILFHEDKTDKTMVFPQGMTYKRAQEILTLKEAEASKVINFSKVFDYRPEDGGHAATVVMKRVFGLTIQQSIFTMFGESKPQELTIATGFGKTTTIPWGKIMIPALEGANLFFDSASSKNGPVFRIAVESPKRHKATIDSLFAEIQKELEAGSIYRGKAMVGAWDLEFLDTSKTDPNKIVFSDYVTEALDAALYGTIKNRLNMKAAGLPVKRSVLLYGPFGTGKSSVGQITALVAEQNGWTFLQARTGEDSVEQVLQTAKLYQPAVVFVEDLGEQASALSSSDKISSLLETFDGITSKDTEIVMVMTTNHVENIHRGMLRPGRIDLALEVGPLDRGGTERLFKAVVKPSRLSEDVDYDVLYEHMKEWEPAWVKAVADRAQIWAINRNAGKLDYVLTTSDLVNSADSLGSQLELLRKASEGVVVPKLDQALQAVFEGALHGVAIVDSDGDPGYQYLSTASRAVEKSIK